MVKPQVKNTKKSYLRKISDIAILSSMSVAIVMGFSGCDDNKGTSAQELSKKQGVVVTLQEQGDGSYKIIDEVPSHNGDTTIIVVDSNGNKRILSQDEVNSLVAEEERRIDNGTSTLTSGEGGGLGIGGAILASAAGALIGSYIGNKLFNNPNYQANAQRGYSSPSAYQRSQSSFNRGGATGAAPRATTSNFQRSASTTPSNAKSGFFNSNTTSTARSTYSSGGGFGG